MKFKQVNWREASGTCLMGYVETTYDKLVAVFGAPRRGPGDKTTCEWVLRFADGTVATIYDWKEDATPTDQYDWHVGGSSKYALDRVNDALASKEFFRFTI